MRSRISNELVAFSILAMLVIGNLFYLFVPQIGKGIPLAQVGDRQAVASIPQESEDAIPARPVELLSKDSLKGINSDVISGSGKGSMVLQTEFAIMFEAMPSLEEITVEWARIRTSYADAMESLMPLARIEEKADAGKVSTTLHLAVGPFPNMQDAAYLCVSLQRKGERCRVVSFSGQPLDLFGQATLNGLAKSLSSSKN